MDFKYIYNKGYEAVIENSGDIVAKSEIIGIVSAVIIILVLVGLWASSRWPKFKGWAKSIFDVFGERLLKNDIEDKTNDDVETIIEKSGYDYDEKSGVFYSRMDAWQRKFGYCQLYDEATAPLGMIIDCEPIKFKYGKKTWMIELWKGQYDFTTGCEVGIYTKAQEINIQGVFEGDFFECVGEKDMMDIAFSLRRNGELMFERKDKHWWLTGFLLGEFSDPSELTMNIEIKMKDRAMVSAFSKGLIKIGYKKNEIKKQGNIVSLIFDTPKTRQPETRKPRVEFMMQWKNQYLCKRYQAITKGYDTMPQKLAVMQEQAPELFEIMMNIGRNRDVFAPFDAIKGKLK